MMRRWHAATILCMLLVSLVPLRSADAEEGRTAIWRGVWNDAELTVVVVARGHGISDQALETKQWWQWGNTETDAYLFYWSADAFVDLVVDFTLEDSLPVARLYVPTRQEDRQAIQYGNGSYSRSEAMQPTLTLWPREAGWLINGLPNFNLEGRELDQTTGRVQWSWRVGGQQPGSPAWSIRSVLPDIDPDAGYPHFQASMRMDPSVSFELATPLMPSWPYLSALKKEEHYGKIQPIFFDPPARTITQNWAGFHIAGMYQINSIAYPPWVNFEAPFAFYQFDPDAGNRANLVIRSDIWPEHTSYKPEYETAIRMTWTAEDANLWRYSLTVAGNHAPESQVTIGDSVLYAVPYSEYPTWIARRSWKAATFVEATDGETGSEGIYDYSVEDNPPVTRWINGESLEPPADVEPLSDEDLVPTMAELAAEPWATFHAPYIEFPQIHPLRLDEGFRGEYSLIYDRVPQLYFSDIDNRVHLLYANEGVWNLGNGYILRSHNMDDGPYINGWTRERVNTTAATITDGVVLGLPGVIEERLYSLNGYLIYSSSDSFVLRRLTEPPYHTNVPVPTDSAIWGDFLDVADSGDNRPRDPGDLKSWLDAFPGDQLRIVGGRASDVRVTSDGFRFVLDLKRSVRVEESPLLDLSGLPPGLYVVTYNGSFSIEPLTPPSITGSLSNATAKQLQPLYLEATLRNSGLRDVPEATLEILAQQVNGEAEVIASLPIQLFAETTVTQQILWVPWQSGEWTLVPQVVLPNGREIRLTPLDVTIASTPSVRGTTVLTMTSSHRSLIAAGLGLMTFASLAGVLCWHLWRQSPVWPGHHAK